MKKIDCWIITKNVEYPNSPQTSYPVRICKDEYFAKELLQSVFDDAKQHCDTKFGTYSNPIWMNEEKTLLKVDCTCYVGWMKYQTIETYHITPCDNDNLFSKQIWIND